MPYEHKLIDVCAPLVSGDKIKKFLLGMEAELSWKCSLFMGKRTKQQQSPKKKEELSSTRKVLLNPLFACFGIRGKNEN